MMQDTYYTPQHTGDSYIFHKISAPRHYWAYIEALNETWVDGSDELLSIDYEWEKDGETYQASFKDYCAMKWEMHYRDLDSVGFWNQQEAIDSLPFVHWKYFWRDCDTHRWKHYPPNKFNDFFEVMHA